MTLALIFKDRRFWPLFWTQFLGALNDNFFKNALVILITYKAIDLWGMNSSTLVAFAGGIFILPFFLFSATAGQLADKYEKADVIRITKITELLVMVIAGIGFWQDNFQLLMIVLFLMGTQSAFFGPLKYGIIPSLVHEDELVPANAAVSMGTFLSILIGTIAGGAVANLQNYVTPVAMGILGFAALGILTSIPIKHTGQRVKDLKVDWTFFRPTLQVLGITRKNKDVFRSVLGISWFWFFGAAILSVLPAYCKDVVYGDGQVGTMFLAMFTIGMGLGSFITERLSGKRVEVGMVPIACLGMSLFMFDLFWVGYTWEIQPITLFSVSEFLAMPQGVRALFDLFMISVCGGCYIVPQYTYVQEGSNREELSRTIAGNNIWNSLFMVVAAVSVMLMGPLGIPMILLCLAAVNTVVSFLSYAAYSEFTLRFWQMILTRVFYKVEVEGAENFPLSGPVIVACNHVSFLDWAFIAGVSPRPVRWVIDHAYYYKPGFAFWFRQGKLIPIATRKENPELLQKAFDGVAASVNDGKVIGLFPEGFISRDGQLRRFQPGVGKIVREHKVSVIPMSISGLWGSVFSYEGGKVFFKMPRSLRRKVKIVIGKPIAANSFETSELEKWITNNIKDYHHQFINRVEV
tara:strand:- start:13072 stop:14970 length:1899 start_codon:yes stop_codon:yes gene_type:complete